ncbi:MAG: alpha/beta hydrolase fold domain-containing protein [Myxococcales bacterium]|nr:alpha/beta hydrolase fold domain-containing protein [Myxococcales bacterium]MCB9643020.1 alpha/beta hydrolase fold domain-containing protein [Myxococcales bacterium]
MYKSLFFAGICSSFLVFVACQTTAPNTESAQETTAEQVKQDAGSEGVLPEHSTGSEGEGVAEKAVEATPTEITVESTSPETTPETNTPKTVFGGARPATLKVPKSYDAQKTYPLIVVLHGYGATGPLQSSYMGMDILVEKAGVLLIAPDGMKDPTGKQYWNATDACCDFANSGVDDVAYIRGLIEEIKQSYQVDPKRVFLVGHSNGGFMSYRMACEAADLIAGIVSLAGATYANDASCSPSQAIHVLQVHGTNDTTISYTGGVLLTTSFPGAVDTVTKWGKYNKCQGTLVETQASFDFDGLLVGSETKEAQFGSCPAGGDVRLWTIQGGAHIPALTENFSTEVWKWMQDHAKP